MSSEFRSFRAMGSDIAVTIWGPPALIEGLIELVETRLEILEQSWSRFRDGSELRRVNNLAGHPPVEVSEDLARLVREMQSAVVLSQGTFNPSMARVMESIGYGVDFSLINTEISPAESIASVALSDNKTVGIHLFGNHLSLDAGVALDPGALGKGLAGDIIAAEMMAAGATGVLLSIGGDISAAGSAGGDPWWIGIVDESSPDHLIADLTSTAPTLGVATSTTARRTWGSGLHHILDPRTGDVLETDLIQATVVADSGVRAEVLTTAAMVMGSAEARVFLDQQNVDYCLVTANGIHNTNGIALSQPRDRSLING